MPNESGPRWPLLLAALALLVVLSCFVAVPLWLGHHLTRAFAKADDPAAAPAAPVADEPAPQPAAVDPADAPVVALAQAGRGRPTWKGKSLPETAGEGKAVGRAVRALAFSPEGRWLAAGGDDKLIRLWETADWRARPALRGHGDAIDSLSFGPDGTLLASASQGGNVRLWDLGGDEAKEQADAGQAGTCVAFAPDGSRLATCSWFRIQLWKTAGSGIRPGPSLPGELGSLTHSVAFAPDSKLLAFGSSDSKVRLWSLDGQKPRERAVLGGNQGSLAVFGPDGRTLATGHAQGLRLWDLGTPEPQQRAVLKGTGPAVGAAFGAPGIVAFSQEDGTVRLWRLGGEPPEEEVVLERAGSVLAFSPDGRVMATGGKDGRVWLWELSAE